MYIKPVGFDCSTWSSDDQVATLLLGMSQFPEGLTINDGDDHMVHSWMDRIAVNAYSGAIKFKGNKNYGDAYTFSDAIKTSHDLLVEIIRLGNVLGISQSRM